MTYTSIIQNLPQELRPTMFELIETLEQNMRAQYAVRREDLDSLRFAVRDLTAAQSRTEQRVTELAEAQQRSEQHLERVENVITQLAVAQQQTEQRVSELTVAQQQTEQRINELIATQQQTAETVKLLVAAQARFEARLDGFETRLDGFEIKLNRVETKLGQVSGQLLESRYRDRAPAYFGRILRRLRIVTFQELEDALDQHLSEDEQDEVRRLDLLVRGRPKSSPDIPEVWLAIEISETVDRHDVERSQRRAAILKRVGYLAVPVVAGEDATKGAKELAQTTNVVLFQNGSVLNWDAALADVAR